MTDDETRSRGGQAMGKAKDFPAHRVIRLCFSERIVGRLDASDTEVYVALSTMMRGMHEHIQNHIPSV